MMRYLILLVTLMLALLGCGSTNTDSSDGGAGGTTSTAQGGSGGSTATGGQGGTTSSMPADVAIGPSAGCTGTTPFAPFNQPTDKDLFPALDLVDESGAPLLQDGALACKRIVPPSVPFTFTGWDFEYTVGKFPCFVEPDVAVSFVAPIAQEWPIVAGPSGAYQVTPIDPSGPTEVHTAIDATVTSAEDALYLCVRLPIEESGDRACVNACSRADGGPDPDTLFSETVDGKVEPLPTVRLSPLSESPTPVIADTFKSGKYEWSFVAYGH